MDKKVKVSVILPTYNDAQHIKNAIESVLGQSFKDFELIVIDDGSTDDTKNILKQYIESDKIKYLRLDHQGDVFARNNGISISNGEYLAFIDSDDEWIDKDKLKKQIEFLDNNSDYVLIGSEGIVVDERKNKLMHYHVPETNLAIKKRILLKNPFIHSSVVVRKDVFLKIGGYSQEKDVKYTEDYNLWLSAGILGKFFNFQELMTEYMIRDGNISSSNKKIILRNNIYLINKYKKIYPNFTEALLFAYSKFFIYSILQLIKNKRLKDKITLFLFKKYRKLKI